MTAENIIMRSRRIAVNLRFSKITYEIKKTLKMDFEKSFTYMNLLILKVNNISKLSKHKGSDQFDLGYQISSSKIEYLLKIIKLYFAI